MLGYFVLIFKYTVLFHFIEIRYGMFTLSAKPVTSSAYNGHKI